MSTEIQTTSKFDIFVPEPGKSGPDVVKTVKGELRSQLQQVVLAHQQGNLASWCETAKAITAGRYYTPVFSFKDDGWMSDDPVRELQKRLAKELTGVIDAQIDEIFGPDPLTTGLAPRRPNLQGVVEIIAQRQQLQQEAAPLVDGVREKAKAVEEYKSTLEVSSKAVDGLVAQICSTMAYGQPQESFQPLIRKLEEDIAGLASKREAVSAFVANWTQVKDGIEKKMTALRAKGYSSFYRLRELLQKIDPKYYPEAGYNTYLTLTAELEKAEFDAVVPGLREWLVTEGDIVREYKFASTWIDGDHTSQSHDLYDYNMGGSVQQRKNGLTAWFSTSEEAAGKKIRFQRKMFDSGIAANHPQRRPLAEQPGVIAETLEPIEGSIIPWTQVVVDDIPICAGVIIDGSFKKGHPNEGQKVQESGLWTLSYMQLYRLLKTRFDAEATIDDPDYYKKLQDYIADFAKRARQEKFGSAFSSETFKSVFQLPYIAEAEVVQPPPPVVQPPTAPPPAPVYAPRSEPPAAYQSHVRHVEDRGTLYEDPDFAEGEVDPRLAVLEQLHQEEQERQEHGKGRKSVAKRADLADEEEQPPAQAAQIDAIKRTLAQLSTAETQAEPVEEKHMIEDIQSKNEEQLLGELEDLRKKRKKPRWQALIIAELTARGFTWYDRAGASVDTLRSLFDDIRGTIDQLPITKRHLLPRLELLNRQVQARYAVLSTLIDPELHTAIPPSERKQVREWMYPVFSYTNQSLPIAWRRKAALRFAELAKSTGDSAIDLLLQETWSQLVDAVHTAGMQANTPDEIDQLLRVTETGLHEIKGYASTEDEIRKVVSATIEQLHGNQENELSPKGMQEIVEKAANTLFE